MAQRAMTTAVPLALPVTFSTRSFRLASTTGKDPEPLEETMGSPSASPLLHAATSSSFVVDSSIPLPFLPTTLSKLDCITVAVGDTLSAAVTLPVLLVESVKYWINEYHIDGFRFDLMGIHDIETMKAIRAAIDEIDPTISIHGEGWTGGECAIPERERAVKQNAAQFAPIAVFSDNIRDGLRGNWMDGDKGGFLVGNDLDETIKFGIVGATKHPQVDYSNIIHANAPYATTPAQVINYVSCHDDPCVVDKLKATRPEATMDEIIKMDLLAQTVIFTSQGVPFIYAGEEVLRDKKMVHNSYNSPDSINEINWSNKATYNNVYQFYRSLIQLRKSHPAFRMNTAESVTENLQFIETEPGIIAYTINAKECGDTWSKIMVIFNRNKETKTLNLNGETWNRCGTINERSCSATSSTG